MGIIQLPNGKTVVGRQYHMHDISVQDYKPSIV